MRIPTIAFAATLLFTMDTAVAQAPPPPQPEPTFAEEVEVTEVLLDAQVTDRDGNVIVGLDEDDFHVEEDGKPVDLTGVEFYSSRARMDAQGRATTAAESMRFFILFFDDQRRVNAEMAGVLARELDAGRRAREWVTKLGPQDYVAVASWDNTLIIAQDFTRDPKALQRGIDGAITGTAAKGNWPSRLPPEGQPSLLRQLPRGNALTKATPTIYEGLQEVAKASRSLVGRKNLVLFTSGFGEVSQGQFRPDPRYDDPTAQILNDANVAVYSVDLLQIGTESPLTNALTLMSSSTGGRYFPNVLNFGAPLETIAGETTGYYLLSYRATHPRGSTGYQTVKVTVSNPEFKVNAREGYRYGD